MTIKDKIFVEEKTEYSKGVWAKAHELIKKNLVWVEYPNGSDEKVIEAENSKKNWHFVVLYGEDNNRKGEFYVDKEGKKGNLVLFNRSKDLWSCTCVHYIKSGCSEKCKHILSCRLKRQQMIAKATERLREKEG